MYTRALDIAALLKHRSLFLIGPRQTGKSTLLRSRFPEARYVDLLEADTFAELSARPQLLRQTLKPQEKIVIIDEVQKLPVLLDEAHLLIERNKSLRFVFTGSSARKLKRGQANLLAGRAWFCRIHPLISPEVEYKHFEKRLSIGSLPVVFDSSLPYEDLRAYVGTYLAEEIRAEGLARSTERFARFLEVAGTTNTQQLNYAKVGNDCGVPPRTVREHYQILQDTLIGYELPVFQKTVKRKAVATPKFYFFDIGVANALTRTAQVQPGSESFGRALEHAIFLELRAYLDYRRLFHELSYWRSQTKLEVDFVVGSDIAIEVKASRAVRTQDYKNLFALQEEINLKRRIVVCMERHSRTDDYGTEIMPVGVFLKKLWADEIIET